MSKESTGKVKQTYSPPRIVHTEVLEGRAIACALADDSTCGAGPIMS